jgi:predicted esterase
MNDDWTVDCLAEHDRGRALQVRANPRVAVMWDDGAQPIPKVVFLRGDAILQSGDDLVAAYNRRIENFARRGEPRTPRPEAIVREQLLNIRVTPTVIRIEGFGRGTAVTEWRLS